MDADEIFQLKQRLALYERHHAICSLITRGARDSLDQALRTSHPTPQRTGTPSEPPHDLQISFYDSSVLKTPNRPRKRPQNSTENKKAKGEAVVKKYAPDDAATQDLSLSLQKLDVGSLSLLGSTATTESITIPHERAQAWTAFGRGELFAKQTIFFIRKALGVRHPLRHQRNRQSYRPLPCPNNRQRINNGPTLTALPIQTRSFRI